MILMFPNVIESIIWWLLIYPSPNRSYITPIFNPMSLICTIYLWREWGDPNSESFTCDFREKRGFSSSFQDFSFHQSLWSEENFSKYELNFSLVSQTHNILFIKLHESHFFITDCKNTFSPKSHEILLRIDWNMFLHNPTWKYYLMKPCSNFQFLVEISPTTHDFGCSSYFSSLWV